MALEKTMREILESRSSVADLMDKLNSLEVIEQTVFEDCERKLIPLMVLINKIKTDQKPGLEQDDHNLWEDYQTLLAADSDCEFKKLMKELIIENLSSLRVEKEEAIELPCTQKSPNNIQKRLRRRYKKSHFNLRN